MPDLFWTKEIWKRFPTPELIWSLSGDTAMYIIKPGYYSQEICTQFLFLFFFQMSCFSSAWRWRLRHFYLFLVFWACQKVGLFSYHTLHFFFPENYFSYNLKKICIWLFSSIRSFFWAILHPRTQFLNCYRGVLCWTQMPCRISCCW